MEDIYGFLDTNLLLPQEQKVCKRKCRGTNDLLFIDKMIMKEFKMRTENLLMAWMEYKMTYDMVPRSLVIGCLETVGTNTKVRRLSSKT